MADVTVHNWVPAETPTQRARIMRWRIYVQEFMRYFSEVARFNRGFN